MSAKDDAKALVDQFAARTGAGVWTYLHRNVVAAELKARIDDPTKINQGQVGFCGPASFLQDLATDDPVLYATMATQLFEWGFTHAASGDGKHAGRFIAPDKGLRTYPLPFDRSGRSTFLPEADWLLMSSIRNTTNDWVWDRMINITQPGMTGGVKVDDIEGFFRSVGYTKVINGTDANAANNMMSVMFANALLSDGYRIVLIIDAALLQGPAASGQANHAVGLLTQIGPNWPLLGSCTVFTWGRKQQIPVKPPPTGGPALDATGNITGATFLQYYYGYVAAKY